MIREQNTMAKLKGLIFPLLSVICFVAGFIYIFIEPSYSDEGGSNIVRGAILVVLGTIFMTMAVLLPNRPKV